LFFGGILVETGLLAGTCPSAAVASPTSAPSVLLFLGSNSVAFGDL
jgi:hypothetical protein